MQDVNGVIIKKGDTVDVAAPTGNDIHNHEFRGTVDSVNDDYVTVVDGDDEYLALEGNKLTVIDEELERKENDAAIQKFLAGK